MSKNHEIWRISPLKYKKYTQKKIIFKLLKILIYTFKYFQEIIENW